MPPQHVNHFGQSQQAAGTCNLVFDVRHHTQHAVVAYTTVPMACIAFVEGAACMLLLQAHAHADQTCARSAEALAAGAGACRSATCSSSSVPQPSYSAATSWHERHASVHQHPAVPAPARRHTARSRHAMQHARGQPALATPWQCAIYHASAHSCSTSSVLRNVSCQLCSPCRAGTLPRTPVVSVFASQMCIASGCSHRATSLHKSCTHAMW